MCCETKLSWRVFRDLYSETKVRVFSTYAENQPFEIQTSENLPQKAKSEGIQLPEKHKQNLDVSIVGKLVEEPWHSLETSKTKFC